MVERLEPESICRGLVKPVADFASSVAWETETALPLRNRSFEPSLAMAVYCLFPFFFSSKAVTGLDSSGFSDSEGSAGTGGTSMLSSKSLQASFMEMP